MHKAILLTTLIAASPLAIASEYCVDRYNEDITKVNSELGTITKRQAEIDARLAAIFTELAALATQLADAANKNPPDVQTIQKVAAQINDRNKEKAKLENEGYNNLDRITQLKGTMPAELQGKLRGCVEATAPANLLVNLAIQSMAILSTGGASLLLPEKSLYVDMSAVLNGYPTGGENSVINQAREAALKALPFGMGSENNDIGKTIRDPGRVVRCLFGC